MRASWSTRARAECAVAVAPERELDARLWTSRCCCFETLKQEGSGFGPAHYWKHAAAVAAVAVGAGVVAVVAAVADGQAFGAQLSASW